MFYAIMSAPMALDAGDRLGPYSIVTLLGAFGMGEVYAVSIRRSEACSFTTPKGHGFESRR